MQLTSKKLWCRSYGYPGKEIPTNKEYFAFLVQQLEDEYRGQGYAPLIDFLLENEENVDAVTCSAITTLHHKFIGNPVDVDHMDERFLPFMQKSIKYMWKENSTRNVHIYSKHPQLQQYMSELREQGQRAHKEYIETLLSEVPSKEAACVNNELEKSSEVPSKEAACENIELGKKIQMMLEQDALQRQQAYDEELDAFKAQYPEMLEMEEKHSEMVDSTSKIQAEISGFSNKLEEFQQNLYENLRAWQSALYPSELKPLARCYLSLLKNCKNSRKLLASMMEQKCDSAVPEDICKGLSDLNRNLEIILKKYEQALNGLEITVYTPQPGDPFDEATQENAEDDECCVNENSVVRRCVLPGFLKENAFSSEPDVLIPAEVEVQES